LVFFLLPSIIFSLVSLLFIYLTLLCLSLCAGHFK
jgi:hypothetical protein